MVWPTGMVPDSQRSGMVRKVAFSWDRIESVVTGLVC
jgi:hypothetical protein